MRCVEQVKVHVMAYIVIVEYVLYVSFYLFFILPTYVRASKFSLSSSGGPEGPHSSPCLEVRQRVGHEDDLSFFVSLSDSLCKGL